jgi:tetratricopeptide (TPR) repeat protein
MIRIFMLFFVVGELCAWGCIQRYGTNLEGEWTSIGGWQGKRAMQELTREPEVDWRAEANRLEPLVKAEPANYQNVSDYAAALMHLGRVKEAVGLLEPLAEKMPGEYRVIANLGTAYELDGQLEKSLKNISQSIKLNSSAHMETEWVHEKILEAKIELAKDPKWLQTHSVLGYDFGSGKKPTLPEEFKKEKREADWVVHSITYQLHERLQFVKPPDATVADLLFDLGNIFALTATLEEAGQSYAMAEKFGAGAKPMITMRAQEMNRLINSWSLRKLADKYPKGTIGGIVGLFVAAMIAARVFTKTSGRLRSRRSTVAARLTSS